jgi:hypothetical protein
MPLAFIVSPEEAFHYETQGSYKSCSAEYGTPPEGESITIPSDELQDIINALYKSGELDDLITEEHIRRSA